MYKIKLGVWVLMVAPLVGFAQTNASFNPIPANFGITNPNALYALDINYDDLNTEKQVFHLFLPDTTDQYPLVVHIHGGGFIGGSPDIVLQDPELQEEIKYFLERGFAYASFGYRLIARNQPDPDGVIKCLNDSKRALQFARYYAQELHINPDKIALKGSSAGSGTSLWLGSRSDMADPDATDPVLRQSTRVCAVVVNGCQATYDLYKWETEIFQNFDGQGTNFTLDSIEQLLGFDRASNFYGGLDSTFQILYDPALIQYREDVDMLSHLSSDDPPIYINSRSQAVHPSEDLFHHAFHGQTIQETALAANLPEVKADIRALSINTTNEESRLEFLERHLTSCALSTTTAPNPKSPTFKVYPNPANTQFTIELSDINTSTIELFSITGKSMWKQETIQSNTISVPVSSWPKGMYIIRVSLEQGGMQIQKLIIE